ncbi:MAG: hypothetical protein ACK4UT_05895 [Moraxellaceae bacterium]
MSTLVYRQNVWWGRQVFGLGQGRHWHMAGLDLTVIRQAREWQCQVHRPATQNEDNHTWHLDAELPAEPQGELSRYVFRATTEHLTLLPRLADRSVVIRPVMPLFVPAGQEVTFYVSTPVWLSASVDGQSAPLLDIPVVRPADTWFGPNTVRGELCYATEVTGRLELGQLTPRPFRAVTPVHIRNLGSTQMPVERINLPVPFLPVYAAESGRLWTPTLEVIAEIQQKAPRIRIGQGVTTEAGHVELLTPARRGAEEHALIRVFDTLFD